MAHINSTINNPHPAILQVLPQLNSGGVERGTVDLAIYAKGKGYRIIVASSGGSMVEKLEAAGIEHFTLPLKTKNPIKIIQNTKLIKKLCLENNVKIIHARSRAPAWSAYFGAKALNIVFITTFHGFYKNNFPLKKYYNAVMAKGDKVIAVSNFMREHILENYKIPAEKITVIHRGIDINEFDPTKINKADIDQFKSQNPLPNNVPIILLPGRITRWKGHDIAIKAAAQIKDQNFVLAIAGHVDNNSNFVQELNTLIKNSNIENRVRFLGDIKNMPLCIAASDIVLSTSTAPETFGRVTAEAGAMGKIAIASDLGGSREIIENGITGYLVAASNPELLAVKLRETLNKLRDENDSAQMAIAARNRIVTNFSLQKMCESTLDIYNSYFKFV